MKGLADPQSWLSKGRRCLSSARTLLRDDDPDVACNRAYYAMYNAAHAALLVVLGQDVLYKSRRGLITALGEHIVMGGVLDAEFGRAINEVQRFRQLADYTGDPIDQEKAAAAVTQAEVFVDAVHKMLMASGA